MTARMTTIAPIGAARLRRRVGSVGVGCIPGPTRFQGRRMARGSETGQTRQYARRMTPRILVLGAGFGGLELATTVSEELGDEVEITLIDKADAFFFGYSKLDYLFRRTTPH